MSDRLRFEQRKDESADMFVLRVLAGALPRIDGNALYALWHYVWKRSERELEKAKT